MESPINGLPGLTPGAFDSPWPVGQLDSPINVQRVGAIGGFRHNEMGTTNPRQVLGP